MNKTYQMYAKSRNTVRCWIGLFLANPSTFLISCTPCASSYSMFCFADCSNRWLWLPNAWFHTPAASQSPDPCRQSLSLQLLFYMLNFCFFGLHNSCTKVREMLTATCYKEASFYNMFWKGCRRRVITHKLLCSVKVCTCTCSGGSHGNCSSAVLLPR